MDFQKLELFKQKAKAQGYSDEEISQFISQKTLENNIASKTDSNNLGDSANISNQSVPEETSFVGNLGSDIGQNIQGILSIPGLIADIASGKVSGGDVGKQIATGVVDEYKGLIKDPVGSFYNKPLSSVLDILPFAQAAKIGTAGRFAGLAGKAGRAGKVAEGASEAERLIAKSATAKAPVTSVAAKTASSNFTVPRKVAEVLKPEETMQKILNYKIKNVGNYDDMYKVSAQITGNNGLLTNINRNALGRVNDVYFGDVMPSVTNLSKKLSKTDKKDLSAIRATLPEQTGINKANAFDLWDSMKQLEREGYNLLNKGAEQGGAIEATQLGQLYVTAAKGIEGVLDDAVKTSKALTVYKNPEIINALRQISPKLADEFINAKNFSDIRGLQDPFYKFQQIYDISKASDTSAFSQLARATTQGKNLGIIGQIPGVNAVFGKVGQGIGDTANLRTAQALNSSPVDLISGIAGKSAQLTKSALKKPATYDIARQIPQSDQSIETNISDTGLDTTPQSDLSTDTSVGVSGLPSQSDLEQAAVTALMSGDTKNHDAIRKIIETYYLGGESSGASQQTLQRAKTALLKINEVEQIPTDLKDKTGSANALLVYGKLNAPGGLGGALIKSRQEQQLADLEAKYFIMVQTALTTIQGSRPSDYDAKVYQARLGPSIKNSPELNASRMENIKTLMQEAVKNPNTVSVKSDQTANDVASSLYQ